jgi:hypothetical protein
LLLASLLFTCVPAIDCDPDVASISAAAGVPLAPDVLTVTGFPAFAAVPGVVGFSAVALIRAVFGVPAVDGTFAVASFSADPGVSIVAGSFTYCTLQRDIHRLSDYRTTAIGLTFFSAIGLSEYRFEKLPIDYWIKASIYRTIGITKTIIFVHL